MHGSVAEHASGRGSRDESFWARGAARDSAVGAVRRHLGTSIDARADYCFDPTVSRRLQAPEARLWRWLSGKDSAGDDEFTLTLD